MLPLGWSEENLRTVSHVHCWAYDSRGPWSLLRLTCLCLQFCSRCADAKEGWWHIRLSYGFWASDWVPSSQPSLNSFSQNPFPLDPSVLAYLFCVVISAVINKQYRSVWLVTVEGGVSETERPRLAMHHNKGRTAVAGGDASITLHAPHC